MLEKILVHTHSMIMCMIQVIHSLRKNWGEQNRNICWWRWWIGRYQLMVIASSSDVGFHEQVEVPWSIFSFNMNVNVKNRGLLSKLYFVCWHVAWVEHNLCFFIASSLIRTDGEAAKVDFSFEYFLTLNYFFCIPHHKNLSLLH